jgi:hypothetical protein
MDHQKILAELYEQRQRIDEAIAALQNLAATGQRKRGRPPKWLAEARKNLEKGRQQKSKRGPGE